MRFNFRQISALATSALMLGMTAGVAAAANYPAPFVVGGAADVAVVYGTGTGVSALDLVQAGNVQSNLQSFMTGTTGGTSTSTSGEIISLDTSATRIWLNTSLNTARSSLTKTELQTVLAETTFSGNVDSKLTHTIKLQAGNAAGGENSGRVIFAKQPKSSNDPVIGISLNTSFQQPLYNASATFSKAVNFSHADSEGEDVTLFGQKFTVSSATDGTDLVLLKEAETVSLTNTNPSATVTIGGSTYTVELVSASDTAATIKVTDSTGGSNSAEINEAASKKIQGLEVAVKTADETNLALSATVIVGSQKVTLTNGQEIKLGTDDNPVSGTRAYIVGGTGATTEIAVAVFAAGTSDDSIASGSSFTDPVFGSFKFDFAGLSSPLGDAGRETLSVGVVGDDTMSLTMTDHRGNTKTFDWAHNQSSNFILADDTNNQIKVLEMSNLTEDQFIVLGNEEYGYLLQVDLISNSSSSAPGNDIVRFLDVFSGSSVTARSPTTEGTTTLDLGGKEYTVTYQGPGSSSGSGGWAQIKYPTGDSANASTFVMYPTIKTKGGALVSLYNDLLIDLSNQGASGTTDVHQLLFPDGDGYTGIEFAFVNDSAWTVEGSTLNLTGSENQVNVTVGQLTYNIASNGTINWTTVSVIDPEDTTPSVTGDKIGQPGLIVFEGKDDSNNYEAYVVDLEETNTADSNDGVGINDVFFSSPTHYEATMQSNSDITKHVDWWGTEVTVNAGDSDQKVASVSYPSSQVYAQIFVGEDEATASSSANPSGTAQLGDILVKDSEVSSVSSTKNLVVVGGSCINSAAATLVGGALCGSAWTLETSVGSGQFLIQSFGDAFSTGNIALLVAGYDAADTVNAATYLRTQAVDTSAGKKYIGTSQTSATLQVAA